MTTISLTTTTNWIYFDVQFIEFHCCVSFDISILTSVDNYFLREILPFSYTFSMLRFFLWFFPIESVDISVLMHSNASIPNANSNKRRKSTKNRIVRFVNFVFWFFFWFFVCRRNKFLSMHSFLCSLSQHESHFDRRVLLRSSLSSTVSATVKNVKVNMHELFGNESILDSITTFSGTATEKQTRRAQRLSSHAICSNRSAFFSISRENGIAFDVRTRTNFTSAYWATPLLLSFRLNRLKHLVQITKFICVRLRWKNKWQNDETENEKIVYKNRYEMQITTLCSCTWIYILFWFDRIDASSTFKFLHFPFTISSFSSLPIDNIFIFDRKNNFKSTFFSLILFQKMEKLLSIHVKLCWMNSKRSAIEMIWMARSDVPCRRVAIECIEYWHWKQTIFQNLIKDLSLLLFHRWIAKMRWTW